MKGNFAVVEDGLDVQELLSFEYVKKRRQRIEEAPSEDVSRPRFEGTSSFSGMDSRGTLLVPSLRAHIVAETGMEAAIEKERRKVREARGGVMRQSAMADP